MLQTMAFSPVWVDSYLTAQWTVILSELQPPKSSASLPSERAYPLALAALILVWAVVLRELHKVFTHPAALGYS